MTTNYTIGTRGSLLAVTQSELIKTKLEKNSKKTFELKKIKTQGDQITNKPLWQLEGKDFFTKELDEQLLNSEIDLTIHSYKDLGSERPNDIELCAITERKYAHDVLLIKKTKINELKQLNILTVGTSSPRRIHNIQHNLSKYLPNSNTKIECKTLRGNINTRIEKLLNDEYDAIVLAMAGLERLASSEESRKILSMLVECLNFMILPQKDFPSAASQGALAIEINSNAHQDLKDIVKSVHHLPTQVAVKKERDSFNSYGGGCHLAVGIHVKKVHDFFIHIHQGEHSNKRFKKLVLEGFHYPDSLIEKKAYFVFSKYDFLMSKIPIENPTKDHNLFVTSTLCEHNIKEYNTLWSAGNRSMKKLLSQGFWVNGSAEGFGHEEILSFKESNFVNLFTKDKRWDVLSHNKASSIVGELHKSYFHEIKTKIEKKYKDELFEADIIYWSSFLQYQTYTEQYPELINKIHACGIGKTYSSFINNKIEVIPCIDMSHLENIIRPLKC